MQPRKLFQIAAVLRPEIRQASRSVEGFIHAKTHDDKLRGPFLQEGFQVPLVTLRPQAVADFITRPGKAAEVQRLFRLGQLDQ
jgi:hypothetical protein